MSSKRKFTIEEARVIGGQLVVHQSDNTRLDKLEAEADEFWTAQHTG